MQTASQDVIRYLEHGFECWNRRAIDEMMDMYTPDAEVDLSQFLPDENVLRGRDADRRLLRPHVGHVVRLQVEAV